MILGIVQSPLKIRKYQRPVDTVGIGGDVVSQSNLDGLVSAFRLVIRLRVISSENKNVDAELLENSLSEFGYKLGVSVAYGSMRYSSVMLHEGC